MDDVTVKVEEPLEAETVKATTVAKEKEQRKEDKPESGRDAGW